MTTTKRRSAGGRPPLDRSAPAVSVHVHMSATLYDKSYAAASRERQTVPEWIREQLRQATATTPKDPP
jgi:GTPase Era involved in 16S rRNA processing